MPVVSWTVMPNHPRAQVVFFSFGGEGKVPLFCLLIYETKPVAEWSTLLALRAEALRRPALPPVLGRVLVGAFSITFPSRSQDSFVNDGPMSYETSSSQEETTPLRSQEEALGESELEKEGRGGGDGTHGDRKSKKKKRGVARFDKDENEKVGVTAVMRLGLACSPKRTAKKGVSRDFYFPFVVRRGPRATKHAFPDTKEGSRCLVLLTVLSKYLGLCGLSFVMSSSMLALLTFLWAHHPLAVVQGYVPAALGTVSADGPLVPPRPPRCGQRAAARELLWKGPGRWRR